MRNWTIRPLLGGTLHRKRSSFLYRCEGVEPLAVPVIMFLLESADERILVDTGCDAPATALDEHHPFERSPDQTPLSVLRALSVEPESVKTVVNTHLHWDHTYGNELLPWARFLVQREELRYAAAPLPRHKTSYEAEIPGRKPPPWTETRFDVLEGDVELTDGVHLLLTPGHTAGLQSVLVDAESGRYLLPSDNVPLYENWNDRIAGWPHIPNSNNCDLASYLETFKRMDSLGARVIPSHDFRVFDTQVYR